MFARTPRLLLRPGWAEDAPALAAAIGDEAIVANLATAPWPYGVDDAAAFLAIEHTRPNFIICARDGGRARVAGGVGLGATPAGGIELGYWIARADWGRGYATEAGRAVLAIARALGIARIEAGHFIDNPASGRVLAKLGFAPTGETRPRASLARKCESECTLFTLEL